MLRAKLSTAARLPRARSPLALLLASALLASGCATATGMPQPLADRRDVEVTAWSWGYEPTVLQVTQGQRIRMTLRSLDVEHSLVNRSLGIRVIIPPRGSEPVVHEFMAPEFGEYTFHSESASGPGVSQMSMRLVVMR